MRYETLDKDFEVIQRLFDCYAPLPIVNETKSYKYWKEYYTSQTKEKVDMLFEKDISFLNYKF
jgi:hypothetical protein